MARLIHLNGPPGIGKSTLSARYADRHPGTLNLDVDALHHLVGGWRDEEFDTWPVVWSLVRAMATVRLAAGGDVVVPQYLATVDEIDGLAALARGHGASFHEVVLVDGREAAIERFHRRARDSDDEWVRHHYRLIICAGGSTVLGTMYDSLMRVVRLRPGAVLVPRAAGAEHATYDLLLGALNEAGPG
ncbi:AAA family ATPase [Micromonospora sp. WMMD708]|uniref:AAA family ATPase n=1 Tax=Micromonospora sp. WMMD708 TaxID=3403464 RepID=UPI003BF46340